MTSLTFFIFFVPILAFILLGVNLIFAPHNPYQEKESAFECGFHSFLGQNRTQFSISFFIFALLFLLFDLEILLVYPYVVSAYINGIYGLIIMLLFFLLLTAGFAFELGKNALKIDSRQFQTAVKNHTNPYLNLSSFSRGNREEPLKTVKERFRLFLIERIYTKQFFNKCFITIVLGLAIRSSIGWWNIGVLICLLDNLNITQITSLLSNLFKQLIDKLNITQITSLFCKLFKQLIDKLNITHIAKLISSHINQWLDIYLAIYRSLTLSMTNSCDSNPSVGEQSGSKSTGQQSSGSNQSTVQESSGSNQSTGQTNDSIAADRQRHWDTLISVNSMPQFAEILRNSRDHYWTEVENAWRAEHPNSTGRFVRPRVKLKQFELDGYGRELTRMREILSAYDDRNYPVGLKGAVQMSKNNSWKNIEITDPLIIFLRTQ